MTEPTAAPPAPQGSRLFELLDRITQGNLWSDILRMREQGMSTERIAKELFRTYDLDVSKQSIAAWLRDADRLAS